jgi:hypothetical protein
MTVGGKVKDKRVNLSLEADGSQIWMIWRRENS